ncbi:MAG: Smr/MutS family protein [Pyrinomonadaceae bacterium]
MRFLNWLKGFTQKTPASTASESAAPVLRDEDSDIDLFNPFPDPVELPLSDVIDLHTIPARDVRRVVEEFLHQAHEAHFPVVRIIHGKGVGVQREIVRSVLARTPYVHDWTDAPPEAGGLGATIVRFKQ